MLARVAADLLLLIHLGFILFAILGGLLAFKWRNIIWLHIPCALWGIGIELTGGICPLTPLENKLRVAAGETGYSAGFIEHYITPVIYPGGLSYKIQILLATLLLAINIVVYYLVFFGVKKNRSGSDLNAL